MNHDYALQLYTVHEECERDFRGMLKKASELGYSAVEFTGFYGLSAKELLEELKNNHLKPASSQMMIPNIAEKIDKVIAYAKMIGLENIACCVGDVSGPEAMNDTITQL